MFFSLEEIDGAYREREKEGAGGAGIEAARQFLSKVLYTTWS